jgi:acyl carrier protein
MSVHDVKDSADLANLGIDSLMTNEVLVDIKREFGADVHLNDFQSLPSAKFL